MSVEKDRIWPPEPYEPPEFDIPNADNQVGIDWIKESEALVAVGARDNSYFMRLLGSRVRPGESFEVSVLPSPDPGSLPPVPPWREPQSPHSHETEGYIRDEAGKATGFVSFNFNFPSFSPYWPLRVLHRVLHADRATVVFTVYRPRC